MSITVMDSHSTCTTCNNDAVQICITCMTNICIEHLSEHPSQCPDNDLYPIELTNIAVEGEEGIQRLKRGKMIDRAIEYMRNSLEVVRSEMQCTIDAEFEKCLKELTKGKKQAEESLEAEILQLASYIDTFEQRMKAAKYSKEVTPEAIIDSLFFENSPQEALLTLEKTSFITVNYNPKLRMELAKSLCIIEHDERLWEEVESNTSCEWAYRYLLLLEKNIRFYDLENKAICQSSISIDYPSLRSYIPLPTGEYFISGGIQLGCYLIDCNYSSAKIIGYLSYPRCYPGMVCHNRSIYHFGGKNKEEVLSSVEIFSLKSGKSSVLRSKMHEPRYLFNPCIHAMQIFIFGGTSNIIEKFDIASKSFSIVPAKLPTIDPAVAFTKQDGEIIVISPSVHCFNPYDNELEQLGTYSVSAISIITPFQYQNKFWFVVMETDDYLLMSFDLKTYELQDESVRFQIKSDP